MHNQKAQGIVEFALVLPLFLLLVMGIIYFGMAFSDYLTMSNTVRSIAHEASLKENNNDYPTVVQNCTSGVALVNDIFIWRPDSSGINNTYLNVTYDTSTKNVVVTATAEYNNNSTIGTVLKNFVGNSAEGDINIRYSMYSASHK